MSVLKTGQTKIGDRTKTRSYYYCNDNWYKVGVRVCRDYSNSFFTGIVSKKGYTSVGRYHV